MSKVTISINGRAFTIGCEDGQQAYLRDLAGMIDRHVGDLAERVGQIGDVRLLLMAALIVADELREHQGRADALNEEVVDLRGRLSQAEARQRVDRSQLAELIEKTAEQLEGLAGVTESSTG